MSAKVAFEALETSRAANKKVELAALLADSVRYPPDTLRAWESISSSGSASLPVQDDETVIRGITDPHFDNGVLATRALVDVERHGLSVRRVLPGESQQQARQRCLDEEEARMAEKRLAKPTQSAMLNVRGVSELSVMDVRSIIEDCPPESGNPRRVFYVFNSNAELDCSHADICAAVPTKDPSQINYLRARSDLLRLLVNGFIPKP